MIRLWLAILFVCLPGPGDAKYAACHSKSIEIPYQSGLEVVNIEAFEVKSYTDYTSNPTLPLYHLPLHSKPIDFCNITVTYTHPGTGDSINVLIWLPLNNWNERYLAHGGGGFLGCFDGATAVGVSNGFASVSTDTGHGRFDISSNSWLLKSPGNVDLQAFHDWSSVALGEMTVIAKQVIEGFYGEEPKYSYFSGCSGGGRQGLILAQQFHKDFDGILASAPGIGLADAGVMMNWGHVQMTRVGYFPPPCELQAIHAAVIEACDELDGIKDGIISAPKLCKFDVESALDRPACDGKRVIEQAIEIAKAAYTSPQSGPKGLGPLLSLTMPFATEIKELERQGGLLQTTCEGHSDNCESLPFFFGLDWVKYLVAKKPDIAAGLLSEEQLFEHLRFSQQHYASWANADWADLTPFGKAGGKMITWHGLADQYLNHNSTAAYYERVLANDPKANDYYRHFEAPGVLHCYGGNGFYPSNVWEALVDWVENGKAPDQLLGQVQHAVASKAATRPLCVYPQVAQYVGGDPKKAASFRCAEDFGKKKAQFEPIEHNEL